jgi:hypothetical protein
MAAAAIHVVPDDNFDDWVVRADIGQEFGHYATLEAAERIAQAIAQEREGPNSSSTSPAEKHPNAFCKKAGRQIVPAMTWGIGRCPVTPSCRRHARGSMPAVEAGE